MTGGERIEETRAPSEHDRSPASLDATLADSAARGPVGGSLEAGGKLGRYVILERLGAGGMGVVYAAYDPELDRKIAVKLLHSHVGQDSRASEGHQRLVREAQAMARLSHPNVVAVHDVGERELPAGGTGGVWVAMEFVRGRTIGGWVEDGEHPWAAIVDAYVRAGRGLAAAHAAGLIHRDFKPDNVMMGDDGRVRVMDFGLARQSGSKGSEDLDERLATADDETSLSGSSLDEPLTMAGALVGTPAYMAPEQFLGGDTDARTDQFSFCLALWEALTGERPFAGESVAAIAFAVCEGKHKSPPAGTDVPRSLFKLLERGLSADPDDRWPSMETLLERLEALAHPKRRSWAPAVLTAALVGAIGIGVWTTSNSGGTCEEAGAGFDEVWTDARRGSAREAALAIGLPHATQTWDRTERRLDAYAESWRLARVDACQQARRATAFGDLADRQAACFQERAREFDALVEVFESADQDVLANSIGAVGGLPPVDACLDHTYLASRVDPPADEGTRDAVRRARARLAEARALRNAGRYKASVELSTSLLDEAQAIGYGPLVAEVQLERNWGLTDLSEDEAAIEAAEAAYFEAGAQGQDRVATLAALALTRREIVRNPEIAAGWANHARMSLRRVGERAPNLEVDLLMAEAFVARGQSRHDESIEKGLAALALNIETFGDDHPRNGDLLNNVGSLYHDAMRGSEAAEYLERSLENRRKLLGPDHPKLGLAYANLAVQYMHTDPERAFRYADKALEIRLAAYGPQHPVVADSYFTIGTVNQVNGHPDEAAEAYAKVLEIRRAIHGDEHLALAKPLNNIGALAFARGDYETAIEHYGQALRLYENIYGETHAEIARMLKNRGHAYLRARRYEEATADLERGLAVAGSIWGENDPDLGLLCALLGDAYTGMKELDKAQAVLERGLDLRKGGESPWELALLRSVLGEVLWRRGTDRKRAVELVKQAEAWFAEDPAKRKRGLSSTRAWLGGQREWREDRPTL